MPSARLFLLLLIPPSVVSAQRSTLGPSFTLMAGGGPGVSSGCGQRYIGALGLHLSRPVVSKVVTLQVVGRGYWIRAPWSCNEATFAPLPPPPDGTYIVEQGMDLQARSFVTTDARIGINLPKLATLSAGGGIAWREGHDAPYFVAAIGVPLVDGIARRFGVQFEYQWLRLTNVRSRNTWQSSQLVASEPLGTVHRWSHAITIGMRLGMPL